MFRKVKEFLVNDEELGIEWQRLLSIIFLLSAGLMSFLTYTQIITHWWWKNSTITTTFTPGFLSTIGGTMLVAPLYLRGILKWNKSTYTIISFFLILLVFSSFIELATGGNGNNHITLALIALSILLSWLGIRGIAGASWMLALSAAIYFVIYNDIALGFYGYIYVSCGFLGLVMHSGLNPGALIKDIKFEYISYVNSSVAAIKDEVAQTGSIIK